MLEEGEEPQGLKIRLRGLLLSMVAYFFQRQYQVLVLGVMVPDMEQYGTLSFQEPSSGMALRKEGLQPSSTPWNT